MLSRVRAGLSAVFSTAPREIPPLPGSVPLHRSYILLNSPTPPSAFPSRYNTKLQRALQAQASHWGGIVNFAHTGYLFGSEDRTSITAFSAVGGSASFPNISLENVDDIARQLMFHSMREPPPPSIQPPAYSIQHADELHLYVCTHGARDCRCGDMGGKVFQALEEELDRRRRAEPLGSAKGVFVGQVGHVGGHVYAANILVFPHGDWLGLVTPDDVPSVLDAILSTERRPLTATDPPISPRFWRGRMGLSKKEQINLHSQSETK
ncbi:altered inheritance of mitochondria protein 32 [Favolaschia claudopus]|uniref:Altered inheritance of mitochondria protein 32 n=1 Tax=Favolaschia claudopus TaxID=2862362 RepID=A0AAW0DLI1_9AGAR